MNMALNDMIFALASIVLIAFGSAFFSEWTEKHTQSFTMEVFSMLGMPAILWCIVLIAYSVLEKIGVLV